MRIEIFNCQDSTQHIINDLAHFKDLKLWMSAVKNQKTEFIPLSLGFTFSHRYFQILEKDKNSFDTLFLMLDEIEQNKLSLTNDSLVIDCDEEKRELYIWWEE